ncbi:PaaI family thioesterase [Pseudomonas citronellolis]|uniref:PaaI family thioesterase n=1 Tax=Pseudomonas citronellolis TaxID=53408 RepID=UPI0021BF5F87|nr:PaaI family thioesterase [Pseudomonas citronellolis]UXJ50269.1 PaaI family thioesterase [Pseudomonas citronellolis]
MAKTLSSRLTLEQLRAVVAANPFNCWLQLSVERLTDLEVELRVPGRPQFIGTQALKRIHGGVISSLIDAGCGYAVLAATGHSVSTINLHTDFHRAASLGELRITGHLLHQGGRVCSAEAFIHDAEGTLLASGRGTFYKAKNPHPALSASDRQASTGEPIENELEIPDA